MIKIYLLKQHWKGHYDSARWIENFVILHAVDFWKK